MRRLRSDYSIQNTAFRPDVPMDLLFRKLQKKNCILHARPERASRMNLSRYQNRRENRIGNYGELETSIPCNNSFKCRILTYLHRYISGLGRQTLT